MAPISPDSTSLPRTVLATTRDELIATQRDQVFATARRFKKVYRSSLDVEDLANAGMVGLIEAAERFDKGRAVCFAAYASYRIRGAMLDEIRRAGWYSRYDVARFREANRRAASAVATSVDAAAVRADAAVNDILQTELDEDGPAATPQSPAAALEQIADTLSTIATVHVLSLEGFQRADGSLPDDLLEADDDAPSPDRLAAAQIARTRIGRAIERLPARERALLEMHYGLDQDLQDAGRTMGLSKWATSRLHARAIGMLRDLLTRGDDPR